MAFVALLSPRDWWKPAVASIIGTLVGAIVIFLTIHFWLHDGARQLLLSVPAIHPSTLATARSQISQQGPSALLLAAFQGIPYKVYATELTIAGMGLPLLLLVTIPSRALRLLPVAAAAGVGGHVLAGSIERHFRVWIAAYAVFWLAFYGWYWTR